MSSYGIGNDHSSLLVKLSIITIIILVAVFSFYAYFSCRDLIAAIDEQYKERALSVITTVNATIDNRIDQSDYERIQRMCDNLVNTDPRLLKVSLYVMGDYGKLVRVASSDSDGIDERSSSLNSALADARTIVWKEKFERDKYHIVEILAPIYVDGEPRAYLGVDMDLKSRDAAMRRYISRALMYACVALLALSLLLYLAIRREVFKPLWQLTEGARELARGNLYKRIDLIRNDELGALLSEFNTMAEALQQREEENQRLMSSLEERWAEAETRSHTDFLTNLVNNRSFHDKLDAELNRASRLNSPLSLIFCDLDKFKRFNDTNGHLLGDKALFETAKIIKESVRDYDIAARYGGEEFVVILPDTDSSEAAVIAERIRRNLAAHKFTIESGFGHMTISLGIASYPYDVKEKQPLIAAADAAMYESKRRGGNTTTLFKSLGEINIHETS